MKIFIVLAIGLLCCIVSIFLKRNVFIRRAWFFSGVAIMLICLVFSLLKIKYGIFFIIFILALTGITGAVNFNGYEPIFKKLTDKQNDILKWCGYSTIMLAIAFFLINSSIIPRITLDNNTIRMGGVFGGKFNISEIQSVDTVSVHPKVGLMLGGNGLPNVYVGNFTLASEKMTSKLCIYRNSPPYIKIRMNDNSLFILNFKEPDETVGFYNQLKIALNNY